MARKLISSGSTFEKNIGYSRAVVVDEWVFVSGTTGFDYSNMTISENVVEQCEQCCKNIAAALKEAGAGFEHVVRAHYIVPGGPAEFEKCWPVLRKYFGESRPAVTMFQAGLAEERIKFEIEVTALRR